jgi:hypothetical protein
MYIKAIRDLMRAKTTTAAAAAIGARTGSDPATITDAEMLAGTVTSTRLVTPALIKGYVARATTTAARPTTATVGYCMYDTTLNKPIWLKTAPSTWVDATGVTV